MFEDNVKVKIGRILFEKQNGKELFDLALSLKRIYDDSQKKDQIAGTMAVEIAVAAYFEGCPDGAALASSCIKGGCGYKGLSGVALQNLFQFYCEAGAEVNCVCAYNMGVEYEKGHPPYIVENAYVAALWYKKAADAGYARAQLEIGHCYYEGRGVDIDFDATENYWEMAAKQGNISAQYNLGCLCDGGLADGPSLTSFNPEKAGYWLEQAARNGDKNARELLNRNYQFNQRKQKWEKIVT